MSYYSLLTCSTIEKGTSSIHPWYGSDIFDLDQFINDSRKIVINQFRFPRGIKTAGFKEIRWTSPYLHGKYLHDYLEFINLIFKDVKFIFLTRDLHEIYESQVRAGFGTQEKGYDYFSEHVIDFYEKMRSSNLPIFEIDYKDITFLSEKMVSMFEFLDADYNVDRIRSIISTEHSFANAKKFTSTALVPSTLLSTAAPTQPPERSADYTGIELEVGGTVVRIGPQASEPQIRAVIRGLKSRL
ncbi:hypothetical protein [Methylobacterium aquaticum]|uniref:hypothetical protein n=1 Tax=Methylobacterium aquaticum TaxID=270351 RepID=UPI0012E1CA3A|nr:hypothetical protein [Methylobacterium aquaticum]